MQAQFLFEAIGTHWQIDIENEKDFNKEDILGEIKDFINQFDKDYSRFRSDSLITKISRKKGTYKLPANARKMISFYRKIYELTDHKVTPLIGQVMVDAGYDANYSLISKELSHPPRWDEVLEYNHPNLKAKKAVLLDFGAAGKGYLVDLISKILIKNKIQSFCIDAGGDIYCKDFKQKIGLENPDNISQIIGITEMDNGSICGSAGNRRKWGKFNHIINPHTLKPATSIKAVWVKAKETMIADGISTALFFVDPHKLTDEFVFSYLIIYSDNSFKKSDNFDGELFIKRIR